MSELFIIDVDPGVDDLQAILILLRSPRIHPVAYTTCVGNVDIEQATKNLNTFLYYIGERKYEIFKGSPTTMSGQASPSDGYFSKYGMCGVQFPEAPLSHISGAAAPDAIVKLAHKHSKNINMLCMGPLTNLARACELDPSICDKFKRIYIMGGDRSETVEFNVTKYAEFNSYSDPIAAQIVYQNMKPVKKNGFIVIDWLFCRTHNLNKQLIADLLDIKPGEDNPKKLFYNNIFTSEYSKHIRECPRYLTADPFIAIAAGYPDVIKECTYVNFDGIILDGEQKGHITFNVSSLDPQITLINKMDMRLVESIILDSVGIQTIS